MAYPEQTNEWWPFFAKVAPLVIPELIGTTVITDIVWLVLLGKFAAPVK